MTSPRLAKSAPRGRLRHHALALLAFIVVSACVMQPATAQRIENKVAVFAALDKVTAKIWKLEVPLGQTVRFGALNVTPRVCFTRPPTEPPKTSTFVEVDEIQLDNSTKRLFSGWMFAESPGLNAVEHPVFDLWLTDCAMPVAEPQRPAAAGRPGRPGSTPEAENEEARTRRRVR